MSGVGSLVEGEDSDRVLAQVALVSGVTIGPQVCKLQYVHHRADPCSAMLCYAMQCAMLCHAAHLYLPQPHRSLSTPTFLETKVLLLSSLSNSCSASAVMLPPLRPGLGLGLGQQRKRRTYPIRTSTVPLNT